MDRPIDFDAEFAKYAEKWMHAEMAKGRKPEDMEDDMPDVYMRFINTSAKWLDGVAPVSYFKLWDKPEELLDILRMYYEQKVSVPDLLLERITDLGEKSIAPLMALAGDEEADRELRLTALNLLIELDTAEPMALCVRLVTEREADDDLADAAADLLRNIGEGAVGSLLGALEGASDAAAETILDLLCNYPGNERVYAECEERLETDIEHRALYASFLAKLGDPRAVDVLTRVSGYTELNYLDYIEIRNAIEELGGVLPPEREFAGDPYYESLRELDQH